MTPSDIAVILSRLDRLEETLRQVHEEVKKTNGRVSELEKEEARLEGAAKARESQKIVFTTVLSGIAIAAIVWAVAYLAQ